MPREGARRFTVGGGWGNAIHIEWDDMKQEVFSLHGHKTPKPQVGDILMVPMQSGKRVVAIFIEIRPCDDPPDMFFGKAFAKCYEEEATFPIPSEQSCDSFGGMKMKDAQEAFYELRASLAKGAR